MNPSLFRCALLVLVISTVAVSASAQCNPPKSAGVVICAPTPGATVAYPATVDLAATPASGASITNFIFYDNNTKIWEGSNGQRQDSITNGNTYNGTHNFVVNAWDTDGNFYQAKVTAYVTGEGYPPCAIPKNPGINFCAPPPNAIYSVSIPDDASAKGQSAITNLSLYLNGKFVTSTNGCCMGALVTVAKQGVPNTLAMKATDSTGHHYSASKTVTATYTYGLMGCAKTTCYPGISPVVPQNDAYVGNTFNIDMYVAYNPKPITAMKAYIDNTLVASSTNATLQQEVKNAPDGTHILTVQAWDDEGTEYRIQENININVHE